MGGRRRKPTALRLAEGNLGKRPLPPDEPKPTGEIGDPPETLSKAEAVVWKRVAPFWATDADREALVRYCQLQVQCDEHEATCKAEGWVVENPKSGVLSVHPAARLYHEAGKRSDTILKEFGLTPSSRARVTVPKKPEKRGQLAGVV